MGGTTGRGRAGAVGAGGVARAGGAGGGDVVGGFGCGDGSRRVGGSRRIGGAGHQERRNVTWPPSRSNQPRNAQLIQPPSPWLVNVPDSKTMTR